MRIKIPAGNFDRSGAKVQPPAALSDRLGAHQVVDGDMMVRPPYLIKNGPRPGPFTVAQRAGFSALISNLEHGTNQFAMKVDLQKKRSIKGQATQAVFAPDSTGMFALTENRPREAWVRSGQNAEGR